MVARPKSIETFIRVVVEEETDRRLLKVFGAQSLSLSSFKRGKHTHKREEEDTTPPTPRKGRASKIKQSHKTQSFCFFMFRDS